MKKQTMSLAVTAALLGGAVSANGAMHINDRGLGEALVYPFYSAANGNDTYVHIVNTTGLTKAVKVRFIEARNSQEVLDFNLYLSPEDEWAGAITANPNGDGAIIRTVDNSCTVPRLGTTGGANVGEFGGTQTVNPETGAIVRDQPFVNFNYLNDDDTSVTRTLEGYVEVIEMGQLDPETNFGKDAVHGADGFPADCDALDKAWGTADDGTEGAWRQDANTQMLTWTPGGLYGYGVVINVADGTAAGYDATAIDAFHDGVGNLHQRPGGDTPSLASGQAIVTVFDGAAATDFTMENGRDAASALLMATDIANDYVIDSDIAALTDWVITMPTKRFYVNTDPAIRPFATSWDGSKACEPVAVSHWDREEAFVAPPSQGDNADFSPQPPIDIPVTPDFQLCTEVSVVTFGEGSALNASEFIAYGFPTEYSEGWARMSFDRDELNSGDDLPADARELPDTSGMAFQGLPAVGFAVFNYQNGNLGDGVLANYAAASEHKSRYSISAAASSSSSAVTGP